MALIACYAVALGVVAKSIAAWYTMLSLPFAVVIVYYLEGSFERIHHVLQSKGADGRSVNGVFRGGEDPVDQSFSPVAVSAFYNVTRRFCQKTKKKNQ